MSQTFTVIASSDLVSTLDATIDNNCACFRTTFKGPSAPSSPTPVAGQLWIDDDTPSATVWTLKVYDGTDWIALALIDSTNNVINLPAATVFAGAVTLGADMSAASYKITSLANGTASGDAVNKGQVDARVISNTVPIGSQSASFDRFVVIGRGTMTIVSAYILVGTTVAADAGNYWSFQIRNVTAANNLLAAAKTTAATAITADTVFDLAPDQNLTVANGDVLQLQVTKTSSPTALDAECALILTYKVST